MCVWNSEFLNISIVVFVVIVSVIVVVVDVTMIKSVTVMLLPQQPRAMIR